MSSQTENPGPIRTPGVIQPFSIDLLEMMSLGTIALRESCLRNQYLPNIKQGDSEFPPFFSSKSFSDEIANRLKGGRPNISPPVRIRTRRFDGLIRTLQVPHPIPYSRLVNHLADKWNDLSPFLSGNHSMVKPRHFSDGRLIVMNYGEAVSTEEERIKAAQGRRYSVHADVSNCFPSIYTHAIDWALRGVDTAKKDTSGKSWQSKIDAFTRNCQYGETTGLPIGPVTSNIISELVLQKIDGELDQAGKSPFSFTRYIDDYTAYFDTVEQAEEFIQSLDRALIKYRLSLNTRKTRILETKTHFGEEWIERIHIARPRRRDTLSLLRFLQTCERLAQEFPDRSVLTYGVKVLLSAQRCPALQKPRKKWRRKPSLAKDVPLMHQLLRISQHHPHLFSLFARELRFVKKVLPTEDRRIIEEQLLGAMAHAIRRGETDTILWLTYSLSGILKVDIPDAIIDSAFELNDDFVTLSLASVSQYAFNGLHRQANSLGPPTPLVLGEHWLLRYEAFRVKALKQAELDPDFEGGWFSMASSKGLRFTEGLDKAGPSPSSTARTKTHR